MFFGTHISIGDTPCLAIFIQIDDPDEIVVTVARLNHVGHAFSSWTAPSGATNNYANQRRVKLKHRR